MIQATDLELRAQLAEYTRPWKLMTLAVGIALLIVGSFYYEAPDWDIPISLIMAAFAYLTAPWSKRRVHFMHQYRQTTWCIECTLQDADDL